MSDFEIHAGTEPPYAPYVIVDVMKVRSNISQRGRVDQFNWGNGDIASYRLVNTPVVMAKTLADLSSKTDVTTKPEHYASMPIDPWVVIDTWPIEQQIGFYRGNALKYAQRMGTKDERLKEAKKLQAYADKLVRVLEKVND